MRYQGEHVAQGEAELRWQFWSRYSVVGFVGSGLARNESGATMIVHSPFRSYAISSAVVLGSGTGEVFTVNVPVPEPATYVGLFAPGLAGFAVYRRFQA